MSENKLHIETKCVQGGYAPGNGEPRQIPIVQSTTFKYATSEDMGKLFDLEASGYFYSRLQNPTCDTVARRICELEGGTAAMLTSSGQAANFFAVFNIAGCGDHIVAIAALYGGTVSLFSNTMKKFGIEFTFVAPDAGTEEIEAAFRPNTKALFCETLANPALIVADLELLAEIAHKNQVPLVVDNTFPTPALCRPFDFGADIVVHSSTKYLDGHATSVGGVVIEKGGFDWKCGKFPEFTDPDKSYHGTVYTRDFPDCPFSVKLRVQLVRDMGFPMMPFNAFLTHLGVETLALRMERHSDNALKLAQFLKNHPQVGWVNYPGLEESPEYAKIKKYMPKGASGVLTFGVKGGSAAGEKVMNALKLAAIAVHVADVRTCVLHPASMTHRQLSEAEQIAAGVSPDLIRVSVGIENIDDIIADFDQALKASC